MSRSIARRLWELYEPIHDVAYFTPECRSAADALSLRGFWMGYFAFRAAPLGPVRSATVTASFYGFHPDRVSRALPDAWRYTTPDQALAVRRHGAAAALRRLWDEAPAQTHNIDEIADLAWQAALAADVAGRVLGAANQALPRPSDTIETLWQATTTLREHRGDGHVAVLVSRGVTPVQAHLLKTAAGESDPQMLREARQWSADTWHAVTSELQARGWLDARGGLTAVGKAEHSTIEDQTDRTAMAPWTALGETSTQRLATLLEPLANTVIDSGALPLRNPVGLTRASLRINGQAPTSR